MRICSHTEHSYQTGVQHTEHHNMRVMLTWLPQSTENNYGYNINIYECVAPSCVTVLDVAWLILPFFPWGKKWDVLREDCHFVLSNVRKYLPQTSKLKNLCCTIPPSINLKHISYSLVCMTTQESSCEKFCHASSPRRLDIQFQVWESLLVFLHCSCRNLSSMR